MITPTVSKKIFLTITNYRSGLSWQCV